MNMEETFADISRGNFDAQQFCWTFYNLVHAIDDLVDRDKPLNPEGSCLAVLRALTVFSGNAFFLAHRDQLLPLIHTSVVTYIHSNRLLAKEDTRSKVIGEVLKSEYQGVFFMVAFLVGGIEHQLAMQDKHRCYNFG